MSTRRNVLLNGSCGGYSAVVTSEYAGDMHDDILYRSELNNLCDSCSVGTARARNGNGVSGRSASRNVPGSGLVGWPAGAMSNTRLRRLES